MKPDDRSALSVPARDQSRATPSKPAHSRAAANIVREQINAIYRSDPHVSTAEPEQTTEATTSQTDQPAPQNTSYAAPSGTVSQTSQTAVSAGPGGVDPNNNPYNRTMNHDHGLNTHDDSWRQYHTAWQSYYQQYYERYYTSQVSAAQRTLNERLKRAKSDQDTNDVTVTQDEAINDLRSSIRAKVNQSAKKIRRSRHFMPIMSAVVVVLVFVFLQYNRVLFAYVEAYVSPGAMDAESIIVSPESTTVASNESRLLIPKIAVDVPIVWDANAADTNSLNAAMNKGVVWFNVQGANAKPGEKGNFVVSGHSSNDWTDGGDYKFIFARLEKIVANDVVYVNYNGTRYTYKITSTKVVKPTDVAALNIGNDKPYITLITCTPLGTARDRLLVFGEQISPSPTAAQAATQKTDTSSSTSQMPSNSPTFLERILGIGN